MSVTPVGLGQEQGTIRLFECVMQGIAFVWQVFCNPNADSCAEKRLSPRGGKAQCVNAFCDAVGRLFGALQRGVLQKDQKFFAPMRATMSEARVAFSRQAPTRAKT